LGAIVTVVYSAENEAYRRTKRPAAMLPLLIILFIVSYGILTMLVFEQGQTIESQRGLIREMLKDSTQLASLKDKLSRDDSERQQEETSAPVNGTKVHPPAAKAKESDSKDSETKGIEKDAKKSGKAARTTKQVPGKPAADLEDVRRATRVI
jgi:hypothetical protein